MSDPHAYDNADYEDSEDLDDQADDEDPPPMRMPSPVKLVAALYGLIALVCGFGAVVNALNEAGNRLHAAAFLAAAAVAAGLTVLGLCWAERWGDHLAFGLAFLLTLASLTNLAVLLVTGSLLAVVIICLRRRESRDWFGFA